MELKDFAPHPTLVTHETSISGPSRRCIDAHNHLGAFGGDWAARPAVEFFDHIDSLGVAHYVDLDGGWGEDILDDRLRRYKALRPDQYRVYGGVDWGRWADDGHRFAEKSAKRLEAQAARGAEGLKIWKPFGLHVTDDAGQLAKIDDPRLDPIWETAGAIGLPIMIHIADPVAFFDPITPHNERIEELGQNPDWSFPPDRFPSFSDLIEAFARLVKRHPKTTFIGAHVGCYAENLQWVGALLDACPNLMIDFSARIAELGRQPFAARKFFMDHSDRILFGTDAGPDRVTYAIYARFLETSDEYFSYSPDKIPGSGRWNIYGLNLPAPVLDKVYYENAATLFGLNDSISTSALHRG
ncbi:Predicted metal-dependent hydrolase, TIM-barrel fold [Octadecabacter temperatus]|uniref:Amidohydrolase n=1 Tax=Octadecabacter temperatus TaxID=1458307 RepID=A0A0K0Y869_9RHOB|nr:amidohydrolase family protein [Octadecabacter temperatus]AKS47086.1 Amidohydrolase [Octadecabacter temperatus]SIO46651.1 Predicted metal-dependent hydrolase, TIM-barrel fold [Octadecabacter temperatus]